MKDKISEERVAKLHPKIREEVKNLMEKVDTLFPSDTLVRVVQGFRTIEEQNALYAQGRTKPGPKVTNAKGGSSYHNYGLAIDFAILYDKDKNGTFETLSWDILKDYDKDGLADWKEVVNTFTQAGYLWGGNWKGGLIDNPHLEKSFSYKPSQLLQLYKDKRFIPGTNYVNI